MKKCKYCNKNYSLDRFSIAAIINGKVYRRHKCTNCKVKDQRNRKKRLSLWIQEYKKQQKCIQCNNNDFRVLQFDHLGNKMFNLGEASKRGMALAKIKKEIAKCQILCANCHSIKNYESRNGSII